MSRFSIRPRPLDINKKLPIIKSVKELEDDEGPTVSTYTRYSYLHRLAAENDNEVPQAPRKKSSSEIPTPQFSVVETYEQDYGRTFAQSTSYIRGRAARAESCQFIEYDLDNEDEDWLEEFNKEMEILSPEKFETLLFKLEIMDHKAREKAGVTPTFGSHIPVLLHLDAAAEVNDNIYESGICFLIYCTSRSCNNLMDHALQTLSGRFTVLQSVYDCWKSKRSRWQKPFLRRLQPPPPVNDTNPFNVFRPREKAHRFHTRRLQRRENNVHSFEKLRQVRRNLEQSKKLFEALIKREEKKREMIEYEVNLQQAQMKYKHEARLVEDAMVFPGFPQIGGKFASSEEDYIDSDETNGNLHAVTATAQIKRGFKRRPFSSGWIQRKDPDEPILLFTKPLDPDNLAAAGITQPSVPLAENGSVWPPCSFRGRIGRGGRIIFDRCNPLLRAPYGQESTPFAVPNPMPPPPNG